MHLARRALSRGDPEKTSVTEIATDYGFWELGRFSVVYRSLFGESPLTTLRRLPGDPKSGAIAGATR
jgi:AraC-like DNA-binding protein